MRDYVLRRLLLVPLTFVGITFVAFCFTRFVPGGPIEQALAERQQAEPQDQAEVGHFQPREGHDAQRRPAAASAPFLDKSGLSSLGAEAFGGVSEAK